MMIDTTSAKLRVIRAYALDDFDGAAGLRLTLTTGDEIEALVDVVDGLARCYAYVRTQKRYNAPFTVSGVADMPTFVDPAHIVAIRPTDDVPPTDD